MRMAGERICNLFWTRATARVLRTYVLYLSSMTVNCIECGRPFVQKHIAHVLCGQRCARARWLRRGRRPADPEVIRCADCGGLFLRVNPKRIYCSAACKNRSTARRHKKNEKDRRRQREWARAHAAENNERSRLWARKNPAKRRATDGRRRALELGAAGSWTHSEWTALVAEFGGHCAYCGALAPLTVDHRVPLSRGGSNWIGNLIPACARCNKKKGRRTEEEFRALLEIEVLVPESVRAGRRSAA